MDGNGKRAWGAPELIVIVRGRPEESALAGCKVSDTVGSNTQAQGCVGVVDACLLNVTS